MSMFPRQLRAWTAVLMIAVMSAINVTPAAAGLVPSQPSGATSITSTRDADMLVVQRALENKLVAQKLRDYGMAPEDVQVRLATMPDRDLHTLASASRGLPSGGDATGALIGVLLVILLVILILKLLNKEVIVR
jgi:hypothetical protein